MVNILLLEDGSGLLQETGDFILLDIISRTVSKATFFLKLNKNNFVLKHEKNIFVLLSN